MKGRIIAHRYVLESIMGEGSYSTVYKAFDNENNTGVAVKELKTPQSKDARELFFREINFLCELNHPNITRYLDFVFQDGNYYLILEWVHGRDLLTVMEEKGRIPWEKALFYMKKVAGALAYLQERREPVILKDLKPSNIMVYDRMGIVKIIDLGTARHFSPDKNRDSLLIGTPGYAPPEAYTGIQSDLSADVYSFGATFYHLLTGQDPLQFQFEFPSPLRFNPQIPPELSQLLLDCLKRRGERIPDAKNLYNRIELLYIREEIRKGEDIHQNPLAVSLLILLMIITIGSFFPTEDQGIERILQYIFLMLI